MSTYDTPSILGQPDWGPPVAQPGMQLWTVTSSTATHANLGPFYCGNVPAIELYCNLTSPSNNAELSVNWSLVNSLASPIPQAEVYTCNPTNGCIISDTLPVVTPWCYLTVTTLGGGAVGYNVNVAGSWATTRGLTSFINQGINISQTPIVAAHGVTTTAYGSFIAPGTYSYQVRLDAALTGNVQLVHLFALAGSGRVFEVINPAANTDYQGQVVLGTAQPVFTILNNGAADVNVRLGLVGPAV